MATVLKGSGRFLFRNRLVLSSVRNCSRPVVCSFTTSAKSDIESKDKEIKVVYESEDYALISGVPEEQLRTRKVRIFSPAQNAMQSGSFNTRLWSLEFNTQDRWENPLMGWASSADPLSNMAVEFASKDDAMRFVERQGWDYEVDEKQDSEMRSKSYGANFAWAKRTRVSTK